MKWEYNVVRGIIEPPSDFYFEEGGLYLPWFRYVGDNDYSGKVIHRHGTSVWEWKVYPDDEEWNSTDGTETDLYEAFKRVREVVRSKS
jgi:hypothetical protein